MQLRNPWGGIGNTDGKWNYNDQIWKDVSEEIKNNLRFDENQNEGIFYVDYEQFMKNFKSLAIA